MADRITNLNGNPVKLGDNGDGTFGLGIDGSVVNAVAVVPHDVNDLANVSKAIYVGVDGDVKVDLIGIGEEIVFKNLASGIFYPIKATRIYNTDTTATNIVAVY